LHALARAEAACTRCPLYGPATQVVPGEGPPAAQLMFVGEQPGNDEDLRGRPFVGPAGRVFDRALEEAGLDRTQVFVTNAVKHFKFELRGKRRLHKRPNMYEVERCRWWLGYEKEIVGPAVIVGMGASAAASLLGKAVSVASVRSRILASEHGPRLLITIHPSYLLRIKDHDEKARQHGMLVEDIRSAAKAARSQPSHGK
jgi:DNA polymerase